MRFDLFRFTFTAFRIFLSSVTEKNEPRGISGMVTGLLIFPRAKHMLLVFQLPNALVNKRKLNDKSNLTSWNLLKDGKQTSTAAHTKRRCFGSKCSRVAQTMLQMKNAAEKKKADQQLYFQVKKSQALRSKSIPPCIQPHNSPFPWCCQFRIYFHGVLNLYRYLPSSCLSITLSYSVFPDCGNPEPGADLSLHRQPQERGMHTFSKASTTCNAQTPKHWIYQRCSHPMWPFLYSYTGMQNQGLR